MADNRQASSGPRRDPRQTLLTVLWRLGAIGIGVLIAVGVAMVRIKSGHELGFPHWIALYVATTLITWGGAGLFVRRFALGPATTPLFGLAVFGVVILVGYLLGAVLAPVGEMVGTRIVPLLKPSDLVFYLLAAMTVGGAAGTAFSKNIIYSAWALLFAFMGVAGLYVLLGADFPAVAQVLIYVGGILVLILFAIMLTKQIGGDPHLTNVHLALPVGGALGTATVATLCYMAVMAPWKVVEAPSFEPTSAALGVAFLTEFLLPFEIASVVLLAALIGSVVIARKEIKETSDEVL
ncbi:MAG TPA: NADH-quinone oxidoreductase subunit J [Solirubrobacterales bacterium]|nr:NADH-quinone oxidoreductase subunit J [Solirubrobacterales bacterium]